MPDTNIKLGTLKSVGVTSAWHLPGDMYSAIRSMSAACLGITTQVCIELPQITTVFTVQRSRFQKAFMSTFSPTNKISTNIMHYKGTKTHTETRKLPSAAQS